MRKTLCLLTAVAALLASCAREVKEPAAPQIIPLPEHLQMLEGSFRITADTPIWVDGPAEFTRTAEMLSRRFETVTGKAFGMPFTHLLKLWPYVGLAADPFTVLV